MLMETLPKLTRFDACDLKGSPPADLKRVLAPTSGPREAPERPGKIGKIRKIGKPFKHIN